MQEPVALHTQRHKASLERRLHIDHAALIDVPRLLAVALAFQEYLGELAVLQDGHPHLARFGSVQQDNFANIGRRLVWDNDRAAVRCLTPASRAGLPRLWPCGWTRRRRPLNAGFGNGLWLHCRHCFPWNRRGEHFNWRRGQGRRLRHSRRRSSGGCAGAGRSVHYPGLWLLRQLLELLSTAVPSTPPAPMPVAGFTRLLVRKLPWQPGSWRPVDRRGARSLPGACAGGGTNRSVAQALRLCGLHNARCLRYRRSRLRKRGRGRSGRWGGEHKRCGRRSRGDNRRRLWGRRHGRGDLRGRRRERRWRRGRWSFR